VNPSEVFYKNPTELFYKVASAYSNKTKIQKKQPTLNNVSSAWTL